MSGDGSVVHPRPGRAYYSASARISRLGATGNAGATILDDVQGDITEVEVTLLSSGIATYSVTLNNAYLSTKTDRTGASSLFAPERAQSTTILTHDDPVWPRFKYDAMDRFAFGTRLRIDMCYYPAAEGAATPGASPQVSWVPMIAGPIADMRFSFGDQGLKLQISGQDDLARLQDKQSRRINFDRKAEMSLVRDALRRGGFDDVAAGAVPPPAFVNDDGNGLHEQIQAGQSLYEFVDKFVKKLDFELFMEFASLDAPDSALEVHFEPCRSRRPPASEGVYVIEYGKNLIDFRPSFKVRDQYSAVTVRGRHRDPQIPEEVRGHAPGSLLADELFAVGDETLTPAPLVREHFFPGRPNEPSHPNRGNLDSARAQQEAEAELRKMARDLLTIDATTLGLPRLRPGHHVQVSGLRAPFDGYFYVTQTKHTLNESGFRTQLQACRPGMQIPSNSRSPA